jgi:purine nucleosidase
MTHRGKRAALIVAGTAAGVAALAVLTLAMPVKTWRTGEAPDARVAFALVPGSSPPARRIWIDTDAACGDGPRIDPDDCVAILLLARQRALEIVGISTVAGNAGLDIVYQTTAGLVGRLHEAGMFAGRAAPRVHRGAAHGDKAALQAMHSALDAAPLTIVALGPLTNVAAALEHRPDLGAKAHGVVAVMGRREGHWFHPGEGDAAPSFLGHGPVFRDFNFQQDVRAAAALLAMRLPTTLVPYEAAREVALTSDDMDRLQASGPAGAWVAQRARAWLRYWREEIGQPGFYPFDAVAAAFVLEPRLLRCAPARVRVARAEPPFGWFGAQAMFVTAALVPVPRGSMQARVTYCPEVAPELEQWLRRALAAR